MAIADEFFNSMALAWSTADYLFYRLNQPMAMADLHIISLFIVKMPVEAKYLNKYFPVLPGKKLF